MPATGGNTTKAKVAKLKKVIRRVLGYRCVWCNTNKNVQMAHVRPTKVSLKQKRSQWERCNDAAKNPDCYRMMCIRCHKLFDTLTHDLMRAATTLKKEEPIPF